MNEFASSKGEFIKWKGDSERRRKFIDQLVACTKKNTNKGFAASVVIPDYNLVNLKYLLSESTGQPFSVCGGICIGAMRKWAKRKNLDLSSVLVLIEKGDDDQDELIEIAKREGIRVRSLLKEDACAFQAADFACWKTRITLQNARSMTKSDAQQAADIMRSLEPVNAIVQANHVHDRESLSRHCKRTGIPLR